MREELGRAHSLPLAYCLYPGHDLRRGSILEYVTHGSSSYAFQKNIPIVSHINQDHLYVWSLVNNFRNKGAV